DDAEAIIARTLQAVCEFYDADWSGFIDVDMVMQVCSPYRWHNTNKQDRTRELMAEFEPIECMESWMKAMQTNSPICIPNVEALKESSPDEYALYKKLKARAILSVPVFPRPTGFLVVRNPKKHVSVEECETLSLFAYVMLTNINDKKSTEKLLMTWTPENIESPDDVVIHVLGELKITSASGVITERKLASPAIARLIVFLLLNTDHSYAAREIAEIFWRDEEEYDIDKAAGNLRTQMSRSRAELKKISLEDLISSSVYGYALNDKYNIVTDVRMFDECIEAAVGTSSYLDKVDLMKKAVDLYCGDILMSAAGEHWLIQESSSYHLKYIGVVNDLLELLASHDEYGNIQKYAEKSLKYAPGNVIAYYWLVIAYTKLNSPELAKSRLKQAKYALTDCDYEDLTEMLNYVQ
ncbi:MAG: GAF domain-containing protein, partial [Clostridia bacterium]|nr:GAF domain-containing protein [Clostridia bacterium]